MSNNAPNAPSALMNFELESSVISVLANYPSAWHEYADRVTTEHFAHAITRELYSAVAEQKKQFTELDALAIVAELRDAIDPAISHEVLMSRMYSSTGIASMIEQLDNLLKSRQLYSLSYTISELAFADGAAVERIDRAQAAVQSLGAGDGGDDAWDDAYTAAMQHLELVDKRQSGQVAGIATGLPDLDNALDGGFVRGNLVVIGARPAMGKSALAMTIGLYIAREYHVGMLSMEMPRADLRDRQMAILGRLSVSSIKRPAHGQGLDYSRLVDACEASKTLKWAVSDKSGLNILQVCSMARRLKRTRGLDVLIVDYIGLMSGLDKKQSRAYQIEEISRGLKALAKELDIVVLCLAQVNRGAAERALEPPGLHELRDSGAIEQDADVVAFIHRPIAAKPELGEQWQSYAKLRIAKNRQGRIGDIHLFYRGESTTFEGWSGPAPGKDAAPAVQRRGMQD